MRHTLRIASVVSCAVALIIGDPHQLCHISTVSEAEEESLAREHGVAGLMATWSYNKRSLYSLASEASEKQGEKTVFLAEHYRSHPDIIEFSNSRFYQGELILRTSLGRLGERLGDECPGLFWHNKIGAVPPSSRSAVNEIEVNEVVSLLNQWAQTGLLFREELNFGVVTPFRLQMDRVERVVRGQSWWEQVKGRVTVGTAHRFQGDERDIMIFSPVVSQGMREYLAEWVAGTDQLLNVAITRARGALHVVGDREACIRAGGSLGELARACGNGQRQRIMNLKSASARMAELLTELGLWFATEWECGNYRLDFLVVSPFGIRYDIEVDDRGHRTEEQIKADEVRDANMEAKKIKVLRIESIDIFRHPEIVREVLRRLM